MFQNHVYIVSKSQIALVAIAITGRTILQPAISWMEPFERTGGGANESINLEKRNGILERIGHL